MKVKNWQCLFKLLFIKLDMCRHRLDIDINNKHTHTSCRVGQAIILKVKGRLRCGRGLSSLESLCDVILVSAQVLPVLTLGL